MNLLLKNDWWMCAYFPITISSLNHSVSLVTCCKNRLSVNFVVEVVGLTRLPAHEMALWQRFYWTFEKHPKVAKLKKLEKNLNPKLNFSSFFVKTIYRVLLAQSGKKTSILKYVY